MHTFLVVYILLAVQQNVFAIHVALFRPTGHHGLATVQTRVTQILMALLTADVVLIPEAVFRHVPMLRASLVTSIMTV